MADTPARPPADRRLAPSDEQTSGDGLPAALAAGPPALPAHGGPLDRVGQHAAGLVADAKEWVDLRIKLAQAEVMEKVDTEKNRVVARVVPLAVFGVMAGLGALFGLVAVALFLGWWLGHAAWGFLIVAVVLVLVGLVARAVAAKKFAAP